MRTIYGQSSLITLCTKCLYIAWYLHEELAISWLKKDGETHRESIDHPLSGVWVNAFRTLTIVPVYR